MSTRTTAVRGRARARRAASRRPAAVALVGLLAVLIQAGPAAAAPPASLLAAAPAFAPVSTSPAAGSVLGATPDLVLLTFNRAVASGSLTITGPDGAAGSGSVVVAGITISKHLRTGLPAGAYTVTWTAKPKSGKASTGSYGFTLAAAPSPTTTVPPRTPAATPPGVVVPSGRTPARVGTSATVSGTLNPAGGPGTAPPTASGIAGATPGVTTDAAGVGQPTPSGNALPAEVTGLTTGGPRASGPGVTRLVLLAVLLPALVGAAGWGLYRLRRSRARSTAPGGAVATGTGPTPGSEVAGASARADAGDPVDLFAPRSTPPDRPGPF